MVNRSGTLTGLARAINQQGPPSIKATVENVGSENAPDYRLSLHSKAAGRLVIEERVHAVTSAPTQVENVEPTAAGGASAGETSIIVEISPGYAARLQQAQAGMPITATVGQFSAQSINVL